MKFFEFNQNNSGGSFVVDDNLTHRVLIEADNAEEAINIAESLGMYWDGCSSGMDCSCCGDRWSKPWSNDGMVFPFSYSSFDKTTAESIANRYHVKFEKSKHKKTYGGREWDVVFTTPESYMQYVADEYGWTKPDGYIHYKKGRKVSINTESKKK